ncbi:MAG: nucleotidyltransferase domain-containing protein [Candidatus Woesearchaeota archaeon]
MATPSKEQRILDLILNHSPLKEWHFEELARESRTSRAATAKWLKKHVATGLIRKVKEQGAFPHYTAGRGNPHYYARKRVHALNQLHDSGLLAALLSSDAKTVILFGSIIKGDWYHDSDIDIFILGAIRGFDKNAYEERLGRQIELHVFNDRDEIRKVKSGLMKNVIDGYVLKGSVQDVADIEP